MKNSKLVKIVLGVLLVILVVTGIYLTMKDGETENNAKEPFVFVNNDKLSFTANKNDLDGLSKKLTSKAILREKSNKKYNVYLVIEENTFESDLCLTIKDPNGKVITKIEGLNYQDNAFDITKRTGGYLIASDYDIKNTTGKEVSQEWTIEVSLKKNDNENNIDKSFTGKIYLTEDKMSTYKVLEVTNIKSDVTSNSLKVEVITEKGTSNGSKYFYNIGSGYVESNKSSYEFKNLDSNKTYNIKVYVLDENNIKSNIYETSVKTDKEIVKDEKKEELVIPSILNLEYETTLNSISVVVDVKKGTNEISKYYYSKDDGKTYIESTSNKYTFTNLNDTSEYKIKVKVKDTKGNYSTEYFKNIKTDNYIAPSVKSLDITTTYNEIMIKVIKEDGINEVSEYLYSIDNQEYIKSTDTYVFTNLEENKEYKIKVKVVDTNNKESNVYETSVKTDAYEYASISNVDVTSTFNTLTIKVSAKDGQGKIKEYYYSKDDGSNYIMSTSNSYTFTELTPDVLFNIRVYVKDENGKMSQEYIVSKKTDKYVYSVLTNMELVSTPDSISVSVDGLDGDGEIEEYYYSLNGVDFIKGESNVYEFTNLNKLTSYTVYSYLVDSNKMKSEIVSKEIMTKNDYFANVIKNSYTGQGDNNLYLHDSTLENGANDNSYRYAGSSDTTNNFVCFGSSEENCPDNNLYRIIGVFKDQVKLIKWDYATSEMLGEDGLYITKYSEKDGDWGTSLGKNAKEVIGSYLWGAGETDPYEGTTEDSNTWSYSDLNKVNLNTNYLNYIGPKWSDMIAITSWKIGGGYKGSINDVAKSSYEYEILDSLTENTLDGKATYDAKIGLMYISDYGFATYPDGWKTSISDYDKEQIKTNNWMYMGLYEWTITREATYSTMAFCMWTHGHITSGYTHDGFYAIRPVFYLSNKVVFVSGDGSATNPYKIEM